MGKIRWKALGVICLFLVLFLLATNCPRRSPYTRRADIRKELKEREKNRAAGSEKVQEWNNTIRDWQDQSAGMLTGTMRQTTRAQYDEAMRNLEAHNANIQRINELTQELEKVQQEIDKKLSEPSEAKDGTAEHLERGTDTGSQRPPPTVKPDKPSTGGHGGGRREGHSHRDGSR